MIFRSALLVAALCAVVTLASGPPTTTDLIEAQGYGVESYEAYTDDGFILTLYRITSTPLVGKVRAGSAPVLLQHGFLDTSSTWVINSARESLGFILADAGFDVWLANSRGNQYSMGSWKGLSPSSSSFWAWDWDDMGAYDLPASLRVVRQTTGASSVGVVCHSQGCSLTIGGLSASTNSSFRDSVNVVAALAPVTYMAHQGSDLLGVISALHVDKLLGDKSFQPTPSVMKDLLGVTCVVTPSWCDDILSPLSGPPQHLNDSRSNLYLTEWPDQTSVQDLSKWTASVRSGDYEMDNGTPYQPAAVGVPVGVYYGSNDYLADPRDVATLISALGGHCVRSKGNAYSHFDFTWSDVAFSDGLYADVAALLSAYAP